MPAEEDSGLEGCLEAVNSIFEQPFWLEAVSPGTWAAAEVVNDEGEILGRWPYVTQRRLGFRMLSMPPLTKTLGVFFKNTDAKGANRLGQEKRILNGLVNRLPLGFNVDLRLDPKCDYVLPLYWKGFTLRPCFSYRLEELEDEGVLWSGLRSNIRKEIRKAQRQLVIRDDLPLATLFEMHDKTFRRQGRRSPALRETMVRLDQSLMKRNARKLLCAVDAKGRVHGADYFAFDEKGCFGIAGGADPALRSSGATSLILWEAIRFASSVSRVFDFGGSMIEDIEASFRGFGACPRAYYRVTRLNAALSVAEYVKPRVKKLLNYKV